MTLEFEQLYYSMRHNASFWFQIGHSEIALHRVGPPNLADRVHLLRLNKFAITPLSLLHFLLIQKTPYCVPTHLAQQRDPWNRLHGTPTLASIRREIWYTEPEVKIFT